MLSLWLGAFAHRAPACHQTPSLDHPLSWPSQPLPPFQCSPAPLLESQRACAEPGPCFGGFPSDLRGAPPAKRLTAMKGTMPSPMCPPAAKHRLSRRQRAPLAAPRQDPKHPQDTGTRTQSNPPQTPEHPSMQAAAQVQGDEPPCAFSGAPQALGWGRGAVAGSVPVGMPPGEDQLSPTLGPGNAAGCPLWVGARLREGPRALPAMEKTSSPFARGFWGQRERKAGREGWVGGRC